MDIKPRDAGMSKRSRRLHMLALCAVGLAINFLLSKVPLALNLPLYLDNVGSALAAALGGYLPGIIAGFLTNLVNGIGAHETTYYGALSHMLGVVRGAGLLQQALEAARRGGSLCADRRRSGVVADLDDVRV